MTVFANVEEARDHYAEPVFAEMREERETAPAELTLLLLYIETHLYASDLVSKLTADWFGSKRRLRKIFRQAVSDTPSVYVRRRRMGVASTLLAQPVWPRNCSKARLRFEQGRYSKALKLAGRAAAAWARLKGFGLVASLSAQERRSSKTSSA